MCAGLTELRVAEGRHRAVCLQRRECAAGELLRLAEQHGHRDERAAVAVPRVADLPARQVLVVLAHPDVGAGLGIGVAQTLGLADMPAVKTQLADKSFFGIA